MPSDPDEIAKQAREHAWNWFALHATQRMQAFIFFVVATAFLIAAYASILEKHLRRRSLLSLGRGLLTGLIGLTLAAANLLMPVRMRLKSHRSVLRISRITRPS